MMAIINVIMFFGIMFALSFMIYRYTKHTFAHAGENDDTKFRKIVLPQQNPLRALINQNKSVKAPFYMTPDGVVLRLMEIRRVEGYWHVLVDAANLSSSTTLAKIEEVKISWKNGREISYKGVHDFTKLSEGESCRFYAKIRSKIKKNPENVSITVKNGYGKSFIYNSNISKNDNGEQVMS